MDVPTSNPFENIPGAASLDLRNELEQDLMAIEKNLGSGVVKEAYDEKRAIEKAKRWKTIRTVSTRLSILLLGILCLVLLHIHRYRIIGLVFPKYRLYMRWRQLQWDFARYGFVRPYGHGITGYLPIEDRKLSLLERHILALLRYSDLPTKNAKRQADIFRLKLRVRDILSGIEGDYRSYRRAQGLFRQLQSAVNINAWKQFR